MTITLPIDMETGLNREAQRHGVNAEEFVKRLIAGALPPAGTVQDELTTQARANQSSIDILNQWERQTATDDPAEIARRQSEFEEFKREMNGNRRETDGPDARTPFPQE